MRSDGALTTIFHFAGTNGANPYGGLIQGDDGCFNGTTTFGGPSNLGTIFRLDIRPSIQSLVITEDRVSVFWDADEGNFYKVQWATNANQVFWKDLGGPVQATNTTMCLTDVLDPQGMRFYRVLLLP